MHTYPEMNAKIVGILRIGGDENPVTLYAAARIEELEREVAALHSAPTTVKERPVIFSTDSVRAIREDRKTQTRRAITKILPTVQRIEPNGPHTWAMIGNDNGWTIECPYGITEDRLWVREKWRPSQVEGKAWYAEVCGDADHSRWRSPIYMPRWASRLTLEITAVRVERLHAISDDDAKSEGVQGLGAFRELFSVLWDEINAKRGHPWSANPWVWVIEFKKVE